MAVSCSLYRSALNSASLAFASGLCSNLTKQMLALKATSSFSPSCRAFSTTAWVVSHPNAVTTIIVSTLAITALQTMSFILWIIALDHAPFALTALDLTAVSLDLFWDCSSLNLPTKPRADASARVGWLCDYMRGLI